MNNKENKSKKKCDEYDPILNSFKRIDKSINKNLIRCDTWISWIMFVLCVPIYVTLFCIILFSDHRFCGYCKSGFDGEIIMRLTALFFLTLAFCLLIKYLFKLISQTNSQTIAWRSEMKDAHKTLLALLVEDYKNSKKDNKTCNSSKETGCNQN